VLKEISNKAFNQFEVKIKQIEKVSILYQEQKEEIYNSFKQVERLRNNVIAIDEVAYYTSILTLSGIGITQINNLENIIRSD